jgi:hypothetical protein
MQTEFVRLGTATKLSRVKRKSPSFSAFYSVALLTTTQGSKLKIVEWLNALSLKARSELSVLLPRSLWVSIFQLTSSSSKEPKYGAVQEVDIKTLRAPAW